MARVCEERWQTKTSTVLERNSYMFNNPVISDIKFAFPNKQSIPAHKYVLATSSPVFFAMFYGDLAEKKDSIDITDCESDIFLQLLRYMYCDDVNFQDVNSAIQVWYQADKYDIPALARECVDFVGRTVEPLNAFDVIPHARHFKHGNLEKICWEVIDYNAQQIVSDDSFIELKHEFLLPFLERSSLYVKEATLFNTLDRWATHRCEEASMTVDGVNKRSVLGEDLLKQIRFSLMSPEEFSQVVLPTEILLTGEVIDVFKQFTSVPIPGGLKFSILPRMNEDVTLKSCSMGYCRTDSYRDYLSKDGVMTFTVNQPSMLCGVKIITTKREQNRPTCRVSLSVARRGEKFRQIKDKYFTVTSNWQHGEVNVFFNRPLKIDYNTCYTIETDTDATDYERLYVWSECLRESKSPQSTSSESETSIVSGHCSGLYPDCLPSLMQYKGEIMELFFKV